MWRFAPTDSHAPELFDFLCDMARLAWSDIERQQAGGHKKHHSQSIGRFVSEAQADIARTRLDETFGDDMFRFRLSGTRRLWGFRQRATFHVVWWDWGHKVYPTERN